MATKLWKAQKHCLSISHLMNFFTAFSLPQLCHIFKSFSNPDNIIMNHFIKCYATKVNFSEILLHSRFSRWMDEFSLRKHNLCCIQNEKLFNQLPKSVKIHHSIHRLLRTAGVRNSNISVCDFIHKLMVTAVKSILRVGVFYLDEFPVEEDDEYIELKTKNSDNLLDVNIKRTLCWDCIRSSIEIGECIGGKMYRKPRVVYDCFTQPLNNFELCHQCIKEHGKRIKVNSTPYDSWGSTWGDNIYVDDPSTSSDSSDDDAWIPPKNCEPDFPGLNTGFSDGSKFSFGAKTEFPLPRDRYKPDLNEFDTGFTIPPNSCKPDLHEFDTGSAFSFSSEKDRDKFGKAEDVNNHGSEESEGSEEESDIEYFTDSSFEETDEEMEKQQLLTTDPDNSSPRESSEVHEILKDLVTTSTQKFMQLQPDNESCLYLQKQNKELKLRDWFIESPYNKLSVIGSIDKKEYLCYDNTDLTDEDPEVQEDPLLFMLDETYDDNLDEFLEFNPKLDDERNYGVSCAECEDVTNYTSEIPSNTKSLRHYMRFRTEECINSVYYKDRIQNILKSHSFKRFKYTHISTNNNHCIPASATEIKDYEALVPHPLERVSTAKKKKLQEIVKAAQLDLCHKFELKVRAIVGTTGFVPPIYITIININGPFTAPLIKQQKQELEDHYQKLTGSTDFSSIPVNEFRFSYFSPSNSYPQEHLHQFDEMMAHQTVVNLKLGRDIFEQICKPVIDQLGIKLLPSAMYLMQHGIEGFIIDLLSTALLV